MPGAIGIDFGTEATCAGVYLNGLIEIIPVDKKNYMPSVVAFTKPGRLIGEPALAQRDRNPENTISFVKRLIGRKFNDPTAEDYRKHFPNKMENHDGLIKFSIQYQGQQLLFSPEDIGVMILRKMKETSEIYLGLQIDAAVITVPTYFNHSQRQAIIDIGKTAGYDVIHLLSEPIAAAIAYDLNKTSDSEKSILVIDIGMGKVDLNVLTVKEDSSLEVKATQGDSNLGGIEFVNALVDYLVTAYEEETNITIRDNIHCINKLKSASEKAIRNLSKNEAIVIDILKFFDNKNFKKEIKKSEFEKLCEPFFDHILEHLETVVEESGIKKSDIHDIVLIGGCTTIPRIQEFVRKEFFDGKEIFSSIDPELAVAFGAAVQAAILSGKADDRIKDISLIDIIPLSIGIETTEGKMLTIVPKNTKIPCKVTKTINTFQDSQDSITIRIYEGERPNVDDNIFLGCIVLDNLPKMPKGELEIDVTFEVNKEGVIAVSALEKENMKSEGAIIKRNKGRLTEKEIKLKLEKSEEFEKGEKEREDRAIFMNALENFLIKFRANIDELPLKNISVLDKKKINDACVEVIQWLELNLRAGPSEIEAKREEIISALKPFEEYIDLSWLCTESKKIS